MPTLATTPVSTLRGVGPAMAARLAEAGIEHLQDLWFHLPLRYQDRTRITPLSALVVGSSVSAEGVILRADIAYGRRRSLFCSIQDDSGVLGLRFFHFSAAQKRNLETGRRLRCFGEVRRGASGLEMYHPEYQILDDSSPVPVEEALTPVYPTTAGISQATWRKLCRQAVDQLAMSAVPDLLPDSGGDGISILSALRFLHAPPPDAPQALINDGRHPAQLRLALEELVAHQLSMAKLRRQREALGAESLRAGMDSLHRFMAALPFECTGAQLRVIEEISNDLCQTVPMLRLVQGDVGSGKTVVAACAARQAIASGFQVAIMAPTEILAEQHQFSFDAWFTPHGIEPCLLTGRVKGKKRQALLQGIASGEASLIVGTHALFQEDVSFSRLGLVVVDEQHRFGVHQRLKLTEKGQQPHQLVMTATPIPRTLTMAAYADLDCSVIDELPPGRQAVNTVLIADQRRDEVIERVRAACESGRRAYWVCTLIEESEALECRAAEATWEELQRRLPDLSVGLVHGRLKPADKEAVMQRFKGGEVQLLVATTVIEVGVDVPEASLMIIENPERLGLAQLHQLRGRVGRGVAPSHCVLLFKAPLSQQGQARLGYIRESSDGFYIAEKDLELRGPGEVLGTRQTGIMEFRVVDLRLHGDLQGQAAALAARLIRETPERMDPLIRRWMGTSGRFAAV
jgi:ATP-dependent DNA helicase RecG